jgi:phosphatidylglycerol---prolipoprotein diacylglyceryl transferase
VIDLPFDPDLVIGSVRIAWHSIFAFVGMLIGGGLSIRLARYFFRDDRIYPFAFAVILGGYIAARIAHIADNWASFEGDVGKMISAGGGIATMGAPIGSTVAALIACRWLRLPRGFMFDITVIGIALGEAIARIGDVINGEHHGTPCSGLPWCVRYTDPHTLGQTTYVHPIGIYDLLLMAVTFVVLFVVWRRIRGHAPESRIYWGYLLMLGAGRFFESFLREDPVIALGLQEAHLLGAAYALAGGTMLVVLNMRTKQAKFPPKPLHNPVSGR